jgi:hypothetical protein
MVGYEQSYSLLRLIRQGVAHCIVACLMNKLFAVSYGNGALLGDLGGQRQGAVFCATGGDHFFDEAYSLGGFRVHAFAAQYHFLGPTLAD